MTKPPPKEQRIIALAEDANTKLILTGEANALIDSGWRVVATESTSCSVVLIMEKDAQ